MSLVEKQAANQMQIVMEHDDTTLVDGHCILLDTFLRAPSRHAIKTLERGFALYNPWTTLACK